ncbi:MAG TPA: cyclopropane-fatty-acyl-phospholipid synthase family protein [Aliidongia sp.]|nr:cyclopropane-fatty-acyl-phospholipid synthase family protein [Aliidongia sp.]
MSLIYTASRWVERTPIPDPLTELGIRYLVNRTSRQLARGEPISAEAGFAAGMIHRPIAEFPEAANHQHYELPPEFFRLVLGPRRKYSCCLYGGGARTLAEAETHALAETAHHADLIDGQTILELGCGWGSLSLWMAERFPHARITAVSNARSQRLHIEALARERGLVNLTVVTADMNDFVPVARFDRIVSVEMFEHMASWPTLLGRIRGWLLPHGRLFLHVFSHRDTPYRFDHLNERDWIARHFFTGGIMPSHGLIRRFPTLFEVEAEWRWNGQHYQQTALDWLANFDRQRTAIRPLLDRVYGPAAPLWHRRWRLFFLSTAGLFGASKGAEWGVSHYRLRAT